MKEINPKEREGNISKRRKLMRVQKETKVVDTKGK